MTSPLLVPARMLTQFAFCPRLGYLEWAQGEFAENYYTTAGKIAHQRVDSKESPYISPEEQGTDQPKENTTPTQTVHSMSLSSQPLRLTAKLDSCEITGNTAIPVEYKRGKLPPQGPYFSDQVQLCVQALLLREAGYTCETGVIYYVGSKRRVSIDLTDDLMEQVIQARDEFITITESGVAPRPLVDSKKCEFCSLVGICLPDEVNMLQDEHNDPVPTSRRLLPIRPDVTPLWIQEQGATVALRGEELHIKKGKTILKKFRLLEMAHIVLFGNVNITPQALKKLMREAIPVVYLSTGGWFYGYSVSGLHNNIDFRISQLQKQGISFFALQMARRCVIEKVKNCRTMLRRNGVNSSQETLRRLKELSKQAETADRREALLGVEGMAAKLYFGEFSSMLKTEPWSTRFDFKSRNRRPPKDPVNALLSLAYSLLTKECVVALLAAGLDPYYGYYHQPRYARPSLALDLMEGFRPLIADSVVLRVLNNGQIRPTHFVIHGKEGCSLNAKGRKLFFTAFENRMQETIKHPIFGYTISYRSVLAIQARLYGYFLIGQFPDFPMFLTR